MSVEWVSYDADEGQARNPVHTVSGVDVFQQLSALVCVGL